MGADFYERDEDIPDDAIPVGIGDNSVVNHAIVDKDVRIGKGVRIVNDQEIDHSEATHQQCVVRDGIACIIKGVTLPDGWVLQNSVAAEALA